MTQLVLCSECQRHFRQSEVACPFCQADARNAISSRSTRKAVGRLAFLVGSAVASVACGADSDDTNDSNAAATGTQAGAGSTSGGQPGAEPGSGGQSGVGDDGASGGAGGSGNEIELDPPGSMGAGGSTSLPEPTAVALYGAPPSAAAGSGED